MSTTYEIIAADDPSLPGLPGAAGLPPPTWSNTVAAVVRCEEGAPVEVIGTDGGEPEDQLLWRDWAWVAPALAQARREGRCEVSETHEAIRDAVICVLCGTNGRLSGDMTNALAAGVTAALVDARDNPSSAVQLAIRDGTARALAANAAALAQARREGAEAILRMWATEACADGDITRCSSAVCRHHKILALPLPGDAPGQEAP